MTTPTIRPVHVACLRCNPAVVFFSLYHLTQHYHLVHPLSLNPNLCACSHDESTHNPAPTKRDCQAGSDKGPCPCKRYRRQEAA